MAKELKDLTKRSENYSQWYNDLVVKADLAEQSAVRGCMVIKPYGYAICYQFKGSSFKLHCKGKYNFYISNKILDFLIGEILHNFELNQNNR